LTTASQIINRKITSTSYKTLSLQSFNRLVRFIQQRLIHNHTLNPRQVQNYVRFVLPELYVFYNRFSNTFYVYHESIEIQFTPSLRITRSQFYRLLQQFSIFCYGTPLMASVSVNQVFSQNPVTIHTQRVDFSCCRTKPISVQEIVEGSKQDDVLKIYAKAGKHMLEYVKEEGLAEEFDIFENWFESVASPQYHAKYDGKDRNEESVTSFSKTVEKIAAGALTVRDTLDSDVALPAFFAQLHRNIPRDKDGMPLVISFDQDITDPEIYMTSAAKNTSNGAVFSTTASAVTKQQTFMENCANAQYLGTLLASDETMVPIYPFDISIKNDNIKFGKGRRLFMIESGPLGPFMQQFFGQALDSEHQIPLRTFFNGLASERGIGRYTMARQFQGQDIDLLEVERIIGQSLEDGKSIEQVSEELNKLVMAATNDFTNFEFHHNKHVAMNDHLSNCFYYAPTERVAKSYYKTQGYICENVFILEFHAGGGVVFRGAACIMSSGNFRTLIGNTGRDESYTLLGYFAMDKLKKLPIDPLELRYFNNYVINNNKQGDDSNGFFRTTIIHYVNELFKTIHNELRVKLKPEILSILSNHNFNPCSIMTNKACDFLKYSIIFDVLTGKLQYSRAYQTFLLRILNSNSVEIAPEKMLQISRSYALSAGGCQMAYMHAKVLYEKSLEYLKANNLLSRSIVDRDLFLDGMGTELEMEGDGDIDEQTLTKNAMKHIAGLSEEETPTGVVSFPSIAEVERSVDVDEHLMYRLQQNDVNYAYYRLPQPMVLEFFLRCH